MDLSITSPETVDILIIGAGLAGLSAAYAANLAGRSVTILSKGAAASSSILGFNAPVAADDSADLFYTDTLRSSWNISNPLLSRLLADGACGAVNRLEDLGMSFDRRDLSGREYHLLQPLGCSVPRLVHQGNRTGQLSMERLIAFLTTRGVRVQDHLMAAALLKSGNRITGAVALATHEPKARVFAAKAVVMASGGGCFAQGSTYPPALTGDGYTLAWQAGAELLDLEFLQFEPCRCIWPTPLGISTTLLAKGGVLRNALGRRFVLDSFSSEGAVPKDLLARLIAGEIRAGRGSPHGGVWLDLTGLPADEIRVNHALYDQRFRAVGVDLTREAVEVAPAAHTFLGGIRIDNHCASTVTGLFAAGEAAGGIHGANRLGGSAGTEVYVFGSLAGQSAAKYAADAGNPDIEEASAQAVAFAVSLGSRLGCRPAGQPDSQSRIADIQSACQSVMAGCLGPIRDRDNLVSGSRELERLAESAASCRIGSWAELICLLEVQNQLLIDGLSCQAALMREESRGVHFRVDYPLPDDAHWQKSICFKGAGHDH